MVRRVQQPTARRISVRLWPRRGLGRPQEEALATWLDGWRSTQWWTWEGQSLSGTMQTEGEFLTTDVVEALLQLHTRTELARVDLSEPYPEARQAMAWLQVQRSNPCLLPLLHLYEELILTPEVVVQALGGYRRDAGCRLPTGSPAQPT